MPPDTDENYMSVKMGIMGFTCHESPFFMILLFFASFETHERMIKIIFEQKIIYGIASKILQLEYT